MMTGQYQHQAEVPYSPGLEYSGVLGTVHANFDSFGSLSVLMIKHSEFAPTVRTSIAPVWIGPEAAKENPSLSLGMPCYVDGLIAGPRTSGAYQRWGGCASYAVAPAGAVRPIPRGWSFDHACSFSGSYETAYHGIVECGKVQKGETVLINGASGTLRTSKNTTSHGAPRVFEFLFQFSLDVWWSALFAPFFASFVFLSFPLSPFRLSLSRLVSGFASRFASRVPASRRRGGCARGADGQAAGRARDHHRPQRRQARAAQVRARRGPRTQHLCRPEPSDNTNNTNNNAAAAAAAAAATTTAALNNGFIFIFIAIIISY